VVNKRTTFCSRKKSKPRLCPVIIWGVKVWAVILKAGASDDDGNHGQTDRLRKTQKKGTTDFNDSWLQARDQRALHKH
jgi:hypothetical protein